MTVTLEVVSLILSVVALIVTALGFFASLLVYRWGTEAQVRVSDLLAKVEAKVEVISRDLGGMVKTAFDYAFHPPGEQVQAQALEGGPTADSDSPIQVLGKELHSSSPPGKTLVTLFTLRGLNFTNPQSEEGRFFFNQAGTRDSTSSMAPALV